ncbi:thiopeptide maturation pyridine synthase [Streptosporangium sp. NPDC051023]|uniref:thiopeptide maturation pyridine synthase n=1 Tax=Streptosporangium sp. NPDC051023 TaxID=3155410 RepID=UPI00344F5D0C
MPRAPWHSIQIRYYDEDKDGLILDGVRPLLARLGDVVEEPYILRHWRRGPHLRLNLRATQEAWADEVLPVAIEALTGYLGEHPSTTILDENALLEAHRQLAVRENDHGPLQPWYPDNTLQTEPYEDRLHILGGRRLTDLLDHFHAESTRQAFVTLERVRRGQVERFQVALELMFAYAHVSVPPISRGYMSYRSHADSFQAYCVDRDAVRASFDAKYREAADRLREIMLTQIDAVDHGRTEPHVRDWLAFAEHLKRVARPLIAGGDIDLDFAPRTDYRHLHRVDFLEVLKADPRHNAEILESDWFRAHRLGLNVLYAHLARLGVSPLQRYLFCHLVARAVEEEFEVSPLESARAFARGVRLPAPG